jgi:hypothetical protein
MSVEFDSALVTANANHDSRDVLCIVGCVYFSPHFTLTLRPLNTFL